MRVRSVVIGAVVAILTALTPVARSAAPTVEDRVIALINAERSERLVVHWGLLAAARSHSADMARQGGLSHEGADERVNSAPPDPGEFNGAPDDGFGVAAWCENVTYTVGTSEDEAPQRIFDQWHRGGAHQRCMLDASRNVGAVGVSYDGESWWATFIAEVDSTPPGAPATPKPKPAAPADRDDAPEPEVSAVPDVTDEDRGDTASSAPDATETGVVAAASAAPDASAEPEPGDSEPATVRERERPAIDPEPAVSSAPRDVPAIAESAAVPVVPRPGIGWPELAAVAAVLSIATVLLADGSSRPRSRPASGPSSRTSPRRSCSAASSEAGTRLASRCSRGSGSSTRTASRSRSRR
jgi:uncharacterized protein YkwD